MGIKIIQPRWMLPIMMFMAVLMVGLRAGDIWDALTKDKAFAPVQQVQAADTKKAEEKKTDDKEGAPPAAVAEEKKDDKKAAEKKTVAPPPATSGGSPESDLYKQLMGRREQLDKRAQDLDEREALVVVAENRVDQKIKEMDVMRAQLQNLLGQASAAQQAQIENLVKIYEIMKPKDAAKIFETLEMPVLLGVVQKMKPARTAPIMAEMNPEKAKEVTIALTKRDQLPEVK